MPRTPPLKTFFHRVAPEFEYNPQEPASAEFERMVQLKGWGRKNKRRRDAYWEFKEALVEQFNFNYGKDENSLTGWQALCEVLGVEPIPDRLSDARKIVRSTHVNLVDLADARGRGTKVEKFTTIAKLRAYTLEHEKIFPKKSAKAGGLLKHLLRPILT